MRFTTSPISTCFIALLVTTASLCADLVLLPAKPIEWKVQVQPIIVKENSSNVADSFGDAATEASIKSKIDQIFAQIGIDIEFLPKVNFTNAFVYDGSPGNYTAASRPIGDLASIVNGVSALPLNSNPNVINMMFVEIVPGFYNVPDNNANGLAFVDANGIALHIGEFLIDPDLNYIDPLDVVAAVIAHEICHNLGLDHSTSANSVMYSGSPNKHYLTTSDLAVILEDDFWTDGADFLIEVAATNFDTWVADNGINGGDYGDHDMDGVPNLVEFALNTDAKDGGDTLPQPVEMANGLRWNLTKNSAAIADGINIGVEVASNFSSYRAAGSSGSNSNVHVNSNTALQVSITNAQRNFMRLAVSRPSNAAPYVASPGTPEADGHIDTAELAN